MSKYNIHNLKAGDKIKVNSHLSTWADNRGWGEDIKRHIGGEFTILRLISGEGTERVECHETNYWFPIQCVDPFDKEETISIKWYKKGKFEK